MKNISRYIAIAISVLIIFAIVYYFSNIVAYVLIAWVFSMIGQPMMRFFQRKIKIGKFQAGPSISAVLTMLCYFIIFTALIWMFVPLVVQQAQNLMSVDYNTVGKTLEEPLTEINDFLVDAGLVGEIKPISEQLTKQEMETLLVDAGLLKIDSTSVPLTVEEMEVLLVDKGLVEVGQSIPEQVTENLKKWFSLEKIREFFGSILGFAGDFVFALFSIVFILYFFLKDQGLFVNFLVAITPSKYGDEVRNSLDRITKLLRRYFGGILLQVTIITIFVSVLLGLLGIKNALLIGFFAALINVIPYLGPIIGASFAIFITISSNIGIDFYTEMMPLLGRVLIVFGAMQMLDNFLLQPYIFSNSVLAHPLEIFIVIMMGSQINGIVGMVLAIPVYTVLRVIARSFLSEFRIVQRITEGMEKV